MCAVILCFMIIKTFYVKSARLSIFTRSLPPSLLWVGFFSFYLVSSEVMMQEVFFLFVFFQRMNIWSHHCFSHEVALSHRCDRKQWWMTGKLWCYASNIYSSAVLQYKFKVLVLEYFLLMLFYTSIQREIMYFL